MVVCLGFSCLFTEICRGIKESFNIRSEGHVNQGLALLMLNFFIINCKPVTQFVLFLCH